MSNQQITRLLQSRRDTEALWSAYRGTKWGATTIVMRYQCRSPRLFAQSASDQADKPHRPRAAHRNKPIAQKCARIIARRSCHETEQCSCLVNCHLRQLFPLKVDPLQQRRQFSRFGRIVGGKELQRWCSVADTTSSVDAWRDRKARDFSTIRRLSASRAKERSDSNRHSASTIHHLQRGAHNHPELVGYWDHIRDATNHCEHRELRQDLTTLRMIGQDPLRNFEGKSASR
jgi:hypothetical protein